MNRQLLYLRLARRLVIQARRQVLTGFAGTYAFGQHGVGLTFAEIRDYQPGDDARGLHAASTARRGRPTVKLFQPERQQNVWILVDRARHMQGGLQSLGLSSQSKREAAVEAAAYVAVAASYRQDRVAIVPVDSGLAKSASPPVPRPQVGLRACTLSLASLLSEVPSAWPLGNVLPLLSHRSVSRGLIVLLSDMLGAYEAEDLRPIARRHQVRWYHLLDGLDVSLPQVGLLRLADARTGKTALLDTGSTAVRDTYVAGQKRRLNDVRQACQRLQIEYFHLNIDKSVPAQLLASSNQRERR